MAEEQKNVEVPQETAATGISAPAVEAPAETKPVEETPAAAETAPATEEKPAEEAKPAEETAKAEEKKEEEAKPVEEGHLNHKAQGLSFPKNLIPSKEFFFFGTEAVEPKALSHYLKSEKSAETAHSNIAWASETGKGLLFVGDKKNPSSVISLADATEPEIDGTHKFHLTSKGNKHTFKAANAAERDNWVSQLKLKIAEAKELAATITESETFKATLESFKPAVPAKKEEKAAEETPAEAAATVPATEEAAPAAEEAAKEEETKDERKKDVKSERRSASRKRTSFFGFGKKEESKKDEVKKEAETKAADEVAVETPAAEETPKVEEPAKPVEETAPVVAEEAAKPAEEAAEAPAATEEKPLESPKEKPTATKRNSFFGNVFSKKEKKTPELKATEPEATKEAEAETAAPVIPPVEATTPLAVDVSNPATVPTETTEAAAATSPAPEAKKDLKEKRKSSLPFAFGKRDKSPAPAEGEKKESPFSKLRNTIRGKSPKPAEKPAEETKEETVPEEAAEAKAEEPKTEEAPKVEEPAKPAETEGEDKPKDAAPAPVVTAAA